MAIYTLIVPDEDQATLIDLIRQFLQHPRFGGQVRLESRDDSPHTSGSRDDSTHTSSALARSSSVTPYQASDATPQTRALVPSPSIPRLYNEARRDIDDVITLTETITADILELQGDVGSVEVLQKKVEMISRWQTAVEEEHANTRQSVENLLAALRVVGATAGVLLSYYLFHSYGATFISIFLTLAYVAAYLTLRGYRIPFFN